ncbi:hypothetical protein [Crassaminicella profunda]|uniref:hypothetical protein n=1 Tax=Crassaminicella profunda TaxID=1286698 RepID=UPI001CA7666B|nr:hypothetical protein [Crassaminicella profunda]QZY56672.1 hypothetical protein K7H06_07055 [Crassaminicella profunda]
MYLEEFLLNSSVDIPIQKNIKFSPATLRKMLKKYTQELDQITKGAFAEVLKNNKHKIIRICDGLNESVDKYYNENIENSYQAFEKMMKETHVSKQVPIAERIEEGKIFYRLRSGNTNYRKEDMFHRSFKEKEKRNSCRYSEPGIPGLYLGESIQVCWEECNKPDIDQINISKYVANKDIEVFDLSNNLKLTFEYAVGRFSKIISVFVIKYFESLKEEDIVKHIFQKIKMNTNLKINDMVVKNNLSLEDIRKLFYYHDQNFIHEVCKELKIPIEDLLIYFLLLSKSKKMNIYKYNAIFKDLKKEIEHCIRNILCSIITHPIKIATNFRVKNLKDPFKPEYIISQYLMKWIRLNYDLQNNNILGIKYLSSKTPSKNMSLYNDKEIYTNYAFPTFPDNNNLNQQYCSILAKFFSLTESYNINNIKTLDKSNIENTSLKINNKEKESDILKKYFQKQRKSARIYLDSSNWQLYEDTDFYKLEKFLKKQNATKL